VTPADARKITEMLDEVIRNRRGAALFPGGIATNIAELWITEIHKIGDAELATEAVAAMFITLPQDRQPSPADLRELVQKLRRDRRDSRPALDEPWVREPPRWVKGWLTARYRHNDMRVWPQQKPGYDAILREHPHTRAHVWADEHPVTPEDAERYEAEGEKLTATQAAALLGGLP